MIIVRILIVKNFQLNRLSNPQGILVDPSCSSVFILISDLGAYLFFGLFEGALG